MGSDDVCADVIDSLMPSSLIGLLAELSLGSHIEFPQPEERDVLKEALTLFTAPKPIQTMLPLKQFSKRVAKPAPKKPTKRKA
jgi:hypothetical protein